MDRHAPEDPDLLRAFLGTRDVPCPGCGYNLRGLTGGTCPECRQDLDLRVGLRDGAVAGLVAALSTLFAVAGIGAITLGVVVLVLFRNGRRWPRGEEALMLVWIPLGALVVCGTAGWLLAGRRGRRYHARLGAPGKRVVTWAAVGLASSWVVTWLVLMLFIIR